MTQDKALTRNDMRIMSALERDGDPVQRAKEVIAIMTETSDPFHTNGEAGFARFIEDAFPSLEAQGRLKSSLPSAYEIEPGRRLIDNLSQTFTAGSPGEIGDAFARTLFPGVCGRNGKSQEDHEINIKTMEAIIKAFDEERNAFPFAAPKVEPVRKETSPNLQEAPRTPEAPKTKKPAPFSRKAMPEPELEDDVSGIYRHVTGPERYGEFNDYIRLQLFRPDSSLAVPGLLRLPSALPPAPAGGDPEKILKWLHGEPYDTISFGVSTGILDLGDQGDLMEIGSEIHADPVSALTTYKARTPVKDGAADTGWCARLGRDLGVFSHTHDRAAVIFADTLAKYLTQNEPENAAILRAGGAVISMHEDMIEAICGMLDAEQYFLKDGPADTSGRPTDFRGSISEHDDLSGPLCMERAIRMHMVASAPLGAAMRQALEEFRIAQFCKSANGYDPKFPSRYNADPSATIQEILEGSTPRIMFLEGVEREPVP